jgi:hypothetical protein
MPNVIINIGDAIGRIEPGSFMPKDAYVLRVAKAQLNPQGAPYTARLCRPLELPAGYWVISAKAVMRWEPREDSGPVIKKLTLRVYTTPEEAGASDEAMVSLPLSKLAGGVEGSVYEQEEIHYETATLLMAAHLRTGGQVNFFTSEPRVKHTNIVISAIRVASLDVESRELGEQ